MAYVRLHHLQAADLVYLRVMEADARVVEFLDRNVRLIIENPGSFGGYYPSELQILRLLEMREAMMHPEKAQEAGSQIVDLFYSRLNEEYPESDALPLYVRVGYRKEKWQTVLRGFAATVRDRAIPWPPRVVTVTHPDEQSSIRLAHRALGGTVDVDHAV